jgi:hypothetical protein
MYKSGYLFLVTMLWCISAVHSQYGGGLSPTPVPKDSLLEVHHRSFTRDAFFIGRDYHHNTFRDREKGLKGMAECNFTLADAAGPQNLELCESLGLSVVVSVGPHLFGSDWEKMSEEQIDQYIKKMVEEGGNSRAIIGYHICDEPSATAFRSLAAAVKSVRKYAPGKWSLINLYPNYATIWTENMIKSQLGTKTYREYLEKYVQTVQPDLITYDNYMVQMSMDLDQPERAGKYFTNLVEVRQVALENKIPFWNVVSGNQVRPHTPIPSPANLALQAYTSLAAGASGIRWYTYWQGGYLYAPIDENENKTLTWRYLQEVNRQTLLLGTIIRQLKSTGVYFSEPLPEPSLPRLPGKIVKSVETDLPMMIGEFQGEDNNRYVMAVNLSLEKSANFVLNTFTPGELLYAVSVGEDKPILVDFEASKRASMDARQGWKPKSTDEINRGFWLPAGTGVLFKCTGTVRISW